MCVETALAGGSKDARQHLLSDRAPRGPIAPTAYLSRDHRRPDRLFGAPSGGVNRRIKEKREEGVPLAIQMPHESSDVRNGGRLIEDDAESMGQAPARDCHAVRGHLARRMAVPHGERVLQHVLHLAGQPRAGSRCAVRGSAPGGGSDTFDGRPP